MGKKARLTTLSDAAKLVSEIHDMKSNRRLLSSIIISLASLSGIMFKTVYNNRERE